METCEDEEDDRKGEYREIPAKENESVYKVWTASLLDLRMGELRGLCAG